MSEQLRDELAAKIQPILGQMAQERAIIIPDQTSTSEDTILNQAKRIQQLEINAKLEHDQALPKERHHASTAMHKPWVVQVETMPQDIGTDSPSNEQDQLDKDGDSHAPTEINSLNLMATDLDGGFAVLFQHPANHSTHDVIPIDSNSPEIVEREVKGLLNRLTIETFDSISDQIIAWANKSERDKDGRTLNQVTLLVFEKMLDEPAWSKMYAHLCRKIMGQVSGNVQNEDVKNSKGKPIAGGQLFRKYLLNICQKDFERGLVVTDTTTTSRSKEDEVVKALNEGKEGLNVNDEVVLYSEEYYAAQKAKRQGFCLLRFIGELFKLQMLTPRIMHDCVKKLLGNVENPEEVIESLCIFFLTVGPHLDTIKARTHMDGYFSRMQDMLKSHSISSRIQVMFQEVLDLRERKWIGRAQVEARATIRVIREQASKEKKVHESTGRRNMPRGRYRSGGDRGRSRRGADHGGPPLGPHGWSGNDSTPPRVPPKVDWPQRKIKGAATFGPSQILSKKVEKRESVSQTASSSNVLYMLQHAEATTEDRV